MEETLVICIGNVARSDDGVAHEVARALKDVPGLRVHTTTALDVTHAADAAHAARVFIIDAQRRTAPLVDVTPVQAASAPRHTHGLDPSGLLALTRGLYQGDPQVWLVSVAAPEMEHGFGLSDIATQAARSAAAEVRRLSEGSS